eukprot:1822511-Rhodomonas_salina.4
MEQAMDRERADRCHRQHLPSRVLLVVLLLLVVAPSTRVATACTRYRQHLPPGITPPPSSSSQY